MVKEDEGGYVISIPDLKGCITTAENIEEGMELAEKSKEEGINMNQYCVYLLSRGICKN